MTLAAMTATPEQTHPTFDPLAPVLTGPSSPACSRTGCT